MEYLDFLDISKKVPFPLLLDHLNIPYQEKKGELKGEYEGLKFIVNLKKNLFFSPTSPAKGSVINFLSELKGENLRSSAKYIKDTFLKEHKVKTEIPVLNLEYCDWLERNGIDEQLASFFEAGLCKERSVLSKKICFRLYDTNNKHRGYVGYDQKKKEWVFPKGSKRGDIVYNLHRKTTDYCILVIDPLEVIHLHKIGFPYTIGLLAPSATHEQLTLIGAQFRSVLLLHPNPTNISLRLSPYCFVKAISIDSVTGLGEGDVKAFF